MISHLLDFNQIDDSHNDVYEDMKLHSNSHSMVNDYLSVSDYYRYESLCFIMHFMIYLYVTLRLVTLLRLVYIMYYKYCDLVVC